MDSVSTVFNESRTHNPLTVVFNIADILCRESQAFSIGNGLCKTWYQGNDIAVLFVIDWRHPWNDIEHVFERADIAINLSTPTRSRHRSLLEYELHQIAENEVCTVDYDEFDVDPIVIKSKEFAVNEVQNIVHQAVEAVQKSNYDRLTSDLLSRTVKEVPRRAIRGTAVRGGHQAVRRPEYYLRRHMNDSIVRRGHGLIGFGQICERQKETGVRGI